MAHNAHTDDYLLKRLRELDRLMLADDKERAHRIALEIEKTLARRAAAQEAWRLRRGCRRGIVRRVATAQAGL
jgi:hypothetical protein